MMRFSKWVLILFAGFAALGIFLTPTHEQIAEKAEQVLALPAGDLQGNRDGYEWLNRYDPGNERYRERLRHYQALLDQEASANTSFDQAVENEQTEPAIPDDVHYTIISHISTLPFKESFDIRLNRRVIKGTLELIAQELKRSLRSSPDKIFIVYYLNGMEVGAGGWAYSHFLPDLDLTILGSTVDEFAAGNSYTGSMLDYDTEMSDEETANDL